MAETHSTWIYHPEHGGKVVDHPIGAGAPEGWSFDPNVIADETKRTAEAISGIKITADLAVDGTIDAGSPEEALRAAQERIAALEAVIETGKTENARIDAELSEAESELEAAAQEISDAKAALAEAQERAAAAATRADALATENEELKAALAEARAKPAGKARG